MNNVVPLKPSPNTYFPQDSELYFDVWERPVAFLGAEGKPYENPNYKAVVRMIGNDPVQIGMVGRGYKVLRMKPLCQKIESEMCKAMGHTELQDVKVKDQIAYHGSMLFRQYIFPKLKVDITGRSDSTFRVIIGNSYDGSSTFKMYSGSINSFCTNGQIDGIFDMVAKRHTSGLSIPNMADMIRKSIDVFFNKAETYIQWVDKRINSTQAEIAIKAIPNISELKAGRILDQYFEEVLEHGPNVWALYNAATYYASHDDGAFEVRDTANDTTAAVLLNREKQIRGWEKTEEFQQLVA